MCQWNFCWELKSNLLPLLERCAACIHTNLRLGAFFLLPLAAVSKVPELLHGVVGECELDGDLLRGGRGAGVAEVEVAVGKVVVPLSPSR